MAKIQETLQVWGNSHSRALSIQGEAGSRIIEVTFLDASGAPIDLTGCTPRMVVNNGAPESPMNDGTIIDATGGVADFTITSDMLTIPGEWPCEFVLSGPNYPPLKVHGLTLPVEASNTENAVGSQNQLASLWVALNKADAAAATATQAAADGRQAITDAQAAIAAANQASGTATKEAQAASSAADAALKAASDTQSHYQMIDPTTGKVDYITNILKNLEAYIFGNAITAQAFDNLNLTAQAFDAKNISARDFDSNAKTLLGVS